LTHVLCVAFAHANANFIVDDTHPMVKRFQVDTLFSAQNTKALAARFQLYRQSTEEIESALEAAFEPYILGILSELSGVTDEYRKLYIEAQYHLDIAARRLDGLPHPAGKMASRLETMHTTLGKLIDGEIGSAAERANRFMEKNLVRRLRDIWTTNTPTFFHAGGDDSGRNPRDYLVTCFHTVAESYPEIEWFAKLNTHEADLLIKAIKR